MERENSSGKQLRKVGGKKDPTYYNEKLFEQANYNNIEGNTGGEARRGSPRTQFCETGRGRSRKNHSQRTQSRSGGQEN